MMNKFRKFLMLASFLIALPLAGCNGGDTGNDAALKKLVSEVSLNETDVVLEVGETVELVPTMGGDGIMHPVPVNYYEYQRVDKVTPVNLINKKDEMFHNNKGTVVSYRQYKAMLN